MSREPWLCLVTDRRRLAAAAGRPAEDGRVLLRAQVRGAVRAGVTLVQIRERDLEGGALAALARELVGLAAGSATRIVVNDRLDVALAAGAAGVHLRGDSPAPARLRGLFAPGFLCGKSVHRSADVETDHGADYLLAGTVFPTASKADKTSWLGRAGLAAIVRVAGVVPVLAIGGVTAATAADVAAAGASGAAAIGAFLPAAPDEDVEMAAVRGADTLREAFLAAGTQL